jgi:hypothetical protein
VKGDQDPASVDRASEIDFSFFPAEALVAAKGRAKPSAPLREKKRSLPKFPGKLRRPIAVVGGVVRLNPRGGMILGRLRLGPCQI